MVIAEISWATTIFILAGFFVIAVMAGGLAFLFQTMVKHGEYLQAKQKECPNCKSTMVDLPNTDFHAGEWYEDRKLEEYYGNVNEGIQHRWIHGKNRIVSYTKNARCPQCGHQRSTPVTEEKWRPGESVDSTR